MTISIINNLRGSQVPEQAWARLLAFYLGSLGLPKASLTLLVAGDQAVRGLNRRWRGIDKATDVLSFPALAERPPRGYAGHLGDLALDWPYVLRHHPRFEASLSRETSLLLLHGCLHLCGQHHDSPDQDAALWRAQRRLLKLAGRRASALPLPEPR
jgi:probable rRNA maturation factor